VDTQQVELIGRNLLVGELLLDGLEVARPERDRGVDLIAYLDVDSTGGRFVAAPIQMKAFSAAGFGVDRKYERFPSLLLAYIWYVAEPAKLETYCVTYREALDVADQKGWTKTASWAKGRYSNNQPGVELRKLLAQHRMLPGRWIKKVRALGA
jgi:hypothetical protein